MGRSNNNKKTNLKSGRPPINQGSLVHPSDSTPKNYVNARRKSSKATRSLINLHHQLQKSRAAASANGNENLVKDIDGQIEQLGGLKAYQAASLTGQDRDRGGDSSEKLVEWLHDYELLGSPTTDKRARGLRVLEVGALSSRNTISGWIGKGIETVRRIDLHSQEPDCIEEIDFMDLPVPTSERDKFDVISLSLVLNYVPDIAQRGEMLRRTTSFLRLTHEHQRSPDVNIGQLPCLFVVLPLPCMSNSRYMTHDHFVRIMASLDYVLIEHHDSQKLSYMLFRWTGSVTAAVKQVHAFKKIEINPGRSRNNFAVVLRSRTT